MSVEDADWASLLGLVDVLSKAIVKYYSDNGVADREVGLQAMIVLSHLTMTSMHGAELDFDKFVSNCVRLSTDIMAMRKTASRTEDVKN